MKNKINEIHVIIIWENARNKEKEILDDIEQSFKVLTVNYITWSEKNIYKNFSRFYAIKSRYAKGKMKHCGSGEFILIVVEDLTPLYDIRETSGGKEKVNINLFDKKSLYRKWTEEGHKIHATNSLEETGHNIALFFGKTIEEYLVSIKNNKLQYLNQDLVGTNGWTNFDELFKVLNLTLEYICLRNFEGFFDNLKFDEHLDIDLLVHNYDEAKLVLNSYEVYPYNNRVVNQVIIDNNVVNFDFRYVGDKYMCDKWELHLLKNKYLYKNKYYRPELEDYFFSLLYHALIHKEKIADDYIERFISTSNELGIDIDITSRKNSERLLLDYMNVKDFNFTEPDDMSVYYNLTGFIGSLSLKRNFILKYRYIKKFIKILLNVH